MSERATEVRQRAKEIDKLIANKRVQAKVGPQGAVTFIGLSDKDRDGLTDACIYRRIMASGSVAAKMAITRAEQMAGRTVNRAVVAQGIHSHDGGATWHPRG
jgi:hypothetical protein